MGLFRMMMKVRILIDNICTFFEQAPSLPTTTAVPPPTPATKLRRLWAGWANNNEVDQIKWPKIVILFCLATTQETAIQFHSAVVSSEEEQPMAVQLLILAMSTAFACILVASFVCAKCPNMAGLLVNFGMLFGVTAFFLAASIPLSFNLKCIVWAVYGISLVTVLFVNCMSIFDSVPA